jgi:replicative DNA helicase
VPFYIESISDLLIDAISTRARRVKRQYGIGLLIIDYLQLLRGTDFFQVWQNCTIEVSEITRGLIHRQGPEHPRAGPLATLP